MMEVILKIGIPFSVLLVIIGSLIYLEGRYWKVFVSRILTMLICLILCSLDIYLLAQGPAEIQAKKYIVAMSMALTIYVLAFFFNLAEFFDALSHYKRL